MTKEPLRTATFFRVDRASYTHSLGMELEFIFTTEAQENFG
jgi:hypothetical protein